MSYTVYTNSHLNLSPQSNITWTTGLIQANKLKENENMENLYQVYLVDKDRSVHINETVVAKSEEEAKFEAGVYSWLDNLEMKLSDVTVIVKNLGSVAVED